MAPPRAAATVRAQGEDSDVIVALIRTAFIIAFFCTRYLTGAAQRMPGTMDALLLAAALFNLMLFWSFFRGYQLSRHRFVALVFDLLLVTGAIATLNRSPQLAQTSQDLFGLYYLVVITAAIWFKRAGAVLSAVVAIALVSAVPWFATGQYLTRDLLLGTAKAPLLLLVAIVAGYLVRARDAEHRVTVELQQELRLARALQSAMLPAKLPEVPGYDIGLTFQPARLVGGDFYGVRLLDDDRLLIVLADMAGKSVYGLVHLSLVHSHLQAAADAGLSASGIAEEVNRHTYAALQPESYAAVFIAILRLSDGLLSFANCGHVPPLHVVAGDDCSADPLASGGIVIGAVSQPGYAECSVQLREGDMVVCYSDGVTEARNRRREQFGEERVAEVAMKAAKQPAQAVGDDILAQAQAFAAVGQDDATLLVIKRQGPPGERQADEQATT
jgi:serine phosphatase RsbU (regulator of sigma subunit)